MQLKDRPATVGDPAFGFVNRLPQFIEESTRRQLAAPDIATRDQEVQVALREATERGAEILAHAIRSPSTAGSEHSAMGTPFARVAAQHGHPADKRPAGIPDQSGRRG